MVKVDTINNDVQSNIGQNSMSFTCTSLHVTLLSTVQNLSFTARLKPWHNYIQLLSFISRTDIKVYLPCIP